MEQIVKRPFGKTGHNSTRAIFGAVCLKRATQDEADPMLDLLFEYGVNHIDVAPGYGDAELRVGPWMKHHRDKFFLATKTDQVLYEPAREQFYRSLDRLQVDKVDLLQLHNLTDVAKKEQIMGPDGALRVLIEAKEEGLVRHIGITGHGFLTPTMHLDSLERFDFETVLLPINYPLMQYQNYASDVEKLLAYCKERNIAVQVIKSLARGLWGNKQRNHPTWYDPIVEENGITKAVHWVMSIEDTFFPTIGDMELLPKVFAAAASFKSAPSDEEMDQMVDQYELAPLYSY